MPNTFIFHKVSEKEKEEIRKNSKKLLDKFASKLEKIKAPEGHFESSANPEGVREQGEPWKTDPAFHDLMLLNAPFVDEDSLVAEKGGWKK